MRRRRKAGWRGEPLYEATLCRKPEVGRLGAVHAKRGVCVPLADRYKGGGRGGAWHLGRFSQAGAPAAARDTTGIVENEHRIWATTVLSGTF